MIEFSDLLYGRIQLPRWVAPFLRLPEFARLRGVRLSNVDSFEFKDFGNVSRWEHGVAVAYLASRCGEHKGLPPNTRAELTLAALLHDVATPPFAHTAESVLEGFDHELETQRVLSAIASESSAPDAPVYGSSLPMFHRAVRALARDEGIRVDADEVARMVIGEGDLGYLISGAIDLDNADNVIRGCVQMGMDVDRLLPLRIAQWLAGRQGAPTDLENRTDPPVQAWLECRSRYYSTFFEASEQELAREAFLQHLMRRAAKAGLPRRAVIWNTDEGLLGAISTIEEPGLRRGQATLRDLVERYRLLEAANRVFQVDIEDEAILSVLRAAPVVSWLEDHLSGPWLEMLVLVTSRRFPRKSEGYLFLPSCVGSLAGFKLGVEIQHRQLPDWLGTRISAESTGARLRRGIADAVRAEIPKWLEKRPWLSMTQRRCDSVVESLKSAGDWSFRLSRNENLHSYPSTFVHAIPASLVNCMGLRGELVLDPFGGTGQTAVEAIKYECSAVSADSNTIATLVARARLTPLSARQRARIGGISADEVGSSPALNPPEFEQREKWHHPKTLRDLCRVWSFVQSTEDKRVRQFLTACFSAIIPASTARKGKEHGFFADNTPLPAKLGQPPPINAIELFLARIQRNLEILARFYAFLERSGRDPEKELLRVRVLQLDARNASPEDYGVEPGAVGAIITSPPYLCMADYTLGQRLSYYWIAPGALQSDFEKEIGARRQRFQPASAAERYFSSMEKFAQTAARLLRGGGFLATVLGRPVAKSFKATRVVERVDEIFQGAGFDPLWSQVRPIHWHRNQGYQRLKNERVSVHVRL
jgi:HD superfamily phosphohydrolase